nr:reverse transcriptase domain-containing protein [Tanacetum cinerariifolium]
FHNDKGHITNECMQLKKQIEELVRAGKLSHLINEIKHGRDQSKVGKKETPAKDKPTAIYMVQSWQKNDKAESDSKFQTCQRNYVLVTSNQTRDPDDHVKFFQAAAHVERWAMPTWCHMFNSTPIGAARVWFDEPPPESIDSYKDLKAAFLAYFMQQKKYVKYPVEIYNIKQKDGETIEDFMEREITFSSLATSSGTEGPLVIEAKIGGHMIHRMCVDGGSSMEVLYEHCFNRLRPEVKNQMVTETTTLTGFSGETIWTLEQLRLLVTIGDADHSIRAWMNFMIVSSLSSYNGIIGRLGIKEIQAVPSTAHGMLKS